jgi:hypothetical protein
VHCFPVRIELVFDRNTSANHSFQGRERFILFQIGQFSLVKETNVYLQRIFKVELLLIGLLSMLTKLVYLSKENHLG